MQKSKNIIKISVLALLIVIFTFSFSSCADSNVVKAQTEKMLDAIIANDVDAAYSLMVDQVQRKDFESSFPKLVELFEGVSTYNLKQSGYYTGIQNLLKITRITYTVETNKGDFTVVTTVCEQYEGIYNFYIEPAKSVKQGA